jgi:peptidyl-dipeptidase Dcp
MSSFQGQHTGKDEGDKRGPSDNPLLSRVWATPYQLPPFELIKPDHFRQAFPICMAEHLADVKSILAVPSDKAGFDNIVAAFDRSGSLLKRLRRVFDNLCSSLSSPELQAVQREVAAPLASHDCQIFMSGMYERIDDIYTRRESLTHGKLSAEATRLVERLRLDFVREGACFPPAEQERYSAIACRLAVLLTEFAQNVLGDETSITIPLSAASGELDGLPSYLISAAREAAAGAAGGVAGEEYLITLSRSMVVPLLTFSTNALLRERVWRAWTSRGELDPARDNARVAKEILLLRAEQASMHGYVCYADYALADTMAGTAGRVEDLLQTVWTPAKHKAESEKAALVAIATATAAAAPVCLSVGGEVDPWDWRFLAERVRVAAYDFEEAEVKQYFSLQKMVIALFHCATSLFGLDFVLREDYKSYHPDVRVYEVWQCDDSEQDSGNGSGNGNRKAIIGLFLHDNFSRPFKNSGAWMGAYNIQSRNTDDMCNAALRLPIVVNNNNFAKAAMGEETLLSFDDVRTLFHEFGHGL